MRAFIRRLRAIVSFDHECTCITKNGQRTVCRTCGSACHCGQ